jgi:nitroreductase
MLDVGLINQTICLLANEKGLGSCMLAASVRHPKVLREHVSIPNNKLIAIGIAIGHPDWNSAVNLFERERAPLEELVIWPH